MIKKLLNWYDRRAASLSKAALAMLVVILVVIAASASVSASRSAGKANRESAARTQAVRDLEKKGEELRLEIEKSREQEDVMLSAIETLTQQIRDGGGEPDITASEVEASVNEIAARRTPSRTTTTTAPRRSTTTQPPQQGPAGPPGPQGPQGEPAPTTQPAPPTSNPLLCAPIIGCVG